MYRQLIPTLTLLLVLTAPRLAWANGGEAHNFDEAALVRILATYVVLMTVTHAVGIMFQKATGQTEAIGWLLLGTLLGNAHHLGVHSFDGMRSAAWVPVIAYAGVCVLLVEAALETDLVQMIRNFGRAGLLAALGVAIPLFVVGFGIMALLRPDASLAAKVVIGGMVTPTSLGIAAKILKDQGILSSKSAQLTMNVAAIDDVIGLIVMAFVQAMSGGGRVTPALVAWPVVKAVVFMVTAIGVGYALAPVSSRLLSKVAGGEAMRLKFVMFPCALSGYIAYKIGLSFLMGVYAGAVFLTEAHFKGFDGKEHGAEYLFKGLRYLFVPVFFLDVGMKVDLVLLFQRQALLLFTGCLTVLVATKLFLGRFGGKGTDATVLGLATIPRGEVALVIVSSGLSMRTVDQTTFAVCVAMVIGSAIITGSFLPRAIRRARERDPNIFAPTHPSPHIEEALQEAS